MLMSEFIKLIQCFCIKRTKVNIAVGLSVIYFNLVRGTKGEDV